ncbi:MAG: hypothetical protein HQL10_12315 [Nitrospirae bacterium]|nr:hypothetical protein [Nitrospirota bacterium]
MRTETLHKIGDYLAELFRFLGIEEGFRNGEPYFDTANPPRATIGYGFNIEVTDYLLLVLRQMGIVNNTMTTSKINAIRNAFTTAINNTPYVGNIDEINAQLRTNLNQVANQYGVTSFRLNTTQGYITFREIIDGTTVGSISVPGKQPRLDALLSGSLDHNSKEYIAVMSLYYNGEGIVANNRNLRQAIINDNRAEAWFQIRYASNAQGIHAKRRYREANLFGLYDNGTLTSEQQTVQAKEIMRMYTTHQDEIERYETKYPPTNAGYADILKDAKDYLIANFATNIGKSIDGQVYVGAGLDTYAYKEQSFADYIFGTDKNDLLFGVKGLNKIDGGLGNDVIYGGIGNDQITGGQGDDYIEGGAGNDTYHINTGDGTDTIEDKEGSNTVVVNGKEIGLLIKQADGSYKNPEGKIKATIEGTDLVIYDAVTGAKVAVLNKDFQPRDFGIRLLDKPAEVTTNNTIIGDQDPQNLNDSIADTAVNDRIEGGFGDDDIIGGLNGGSDWLFGGDGSDAITTTSGIVEGNTGTDVIMGGSDDSRLFGENYGEIDTLIADGELAQGTGAKGDFVSGIDGNDQIAGSNGNDALFGGSGHDILIGGGGGDVIFGDDNSWGANRNWTAALSPSGVSLNEMIYEKGTFKGDDTIYAGTGSDYVYAGGGDDEVYAGDGDDTVIGEGKNDFIDGGAGNDTLYGDADDTTLAEQGDDYIDGGAGNDTIYGYAGSDDLFGGDGNDYLQGDDGDDYLDGEADTDTILGTAGSDSIFGGDGNDNLHGDSNDTAIAEQGNDYLDGEAGDDRLVGYGGNDTLFGGDGNDNIEGDNGAVGSGNDYLDGEAGNDTLLAQAGDDEVFGGDGDDWLQGDSGDDYLDGEAGKDTLLGGEGSDQMYGGDGNDGLQGDAGNDSMEGGLGDDKLAGNDGDDEIYGGDGSDQIWGGTGNNDLYGDEGNDKIYGEAGNDYIEGGTGDDTITAGEGANTIYADDGTDQVLTGSGDDYVEGGSGDDVIVAGDGVNTIYGDDGNDQIQGGSGDDYVEGGAGDDIIVASNGINTIYGDSGSDQIWSGTGNDVISGGSGNDWLYGESGNDTYIFSIGSGQDVIWDYDGNSDAIEFEAGITRNDVEFIKVDWDLKISLKGTTDSLTIQSWFNGGWYRAEQFRFADGTVLSSPDIDAGGYKVFGTADNDILTGSKFNDEMLGHEGSDTMAGNSGNDVMNGGAGTDLIMGGEGDDTINGGAGDDTGCGFGLYGEAGNDLLMGGEGNDSLNGGIGDDRLYGDDGDDWLSDISYQGDNGNDYMNGGAGNDTLSGGSDDDILIGGADSDSLYGGSGSDILDGGDGDDVFYGDAGDDYLEGGTGNDYTSGGSGSDIYVFNRGDGEDFISEEDWTGTDIDKVKFGEGITKDELVLSRQDYNLVISLGDSADKIVIGDWFDTQSGSKIENFEFADGTVLTSAEIDGRDDLKIVRGTAGDDYFWSRPYSENTYIVERGGGFDTIQTGMGASGGYNTIAFGEGITPEDLSIQTSDPNGWSGPRVAIGIGNEEGAIIRGDGGEGANMSISDLAMQRFVFADGQELTLDQILGKADGGIVGDQFGTEDADLLRGSVAEDFILGGGGDDKIDALGRADFLSGEAGNDALSAGSGNDYVEGGEGDDVIAGGKGDDYLVGMSGNDVYAFNRGDGNDFVDRYYSTPDNVHTISFGNDITADDISLYANGSGYSYDLVLSINGTQDSITIPWLAMGDSGNFEEYPQAQLRVQFIGEGGTRIFDLGGIVQALQNEILSSSSDAPVQLASDMTSAFELTGTVSAAGGEYAASYARTGNLFESVDNNNGTAGDDTITGGDGADTLIGGKGNDILNGGAGNDTYIYNVGDGIDRINDIATLTEGNTLAFGAGITPESLSLSLGSLLIKTGNAGDEIHLENFNPSDAYGTRTIEIFQFADGMKLTYDQLLAKGFDLTGTTGDDTINGTNVVDRITAFGGNDTINAGDGNDAIYGGDGNDVINGGAGADTMSGGLGDDTYYVDNTGDAIAENADEGTDTVNSSMAYTLGANLENLTLTGVDNIDATGNELNNTIIGNTGNNRLDGSAGADTMMGGTGNDTYIVDNTGDTVIENAVEGTDTVYAVVDYTLGSNVENLAITGDTATRGTGNNLDNIIIGNAGNNILAGSEGNDILQGGMGNDILNGGAGNDTYIYNPGDGIDRINDIATLTEGNTLVFGAGITPASLSLSLGSLLIKTGIAGDEIHLENFNPSDAYGTRTIETFQFADGTKLTYDQLLAKGFDLTGTTGNDVINGTNVVDRITTFEGNDVISSGAGDDFIDAGAGADIINAGEGNDILRGGANNDVLNGGIGNDTYVYNIGDGLDTINDAAGVDTIQMGNGIDFDHTVIRMQQGIAHLRLLDAEGNETSEGIDIQLSSVGSQPIEKIAFADGSIMNMSDLVIESKTTYGTKKSDVIRTGRHDDTVYAYQGNDAVYAGLSNDIIYGSNGNDFLYGEVGNDKIYGDNGRDVLDGGNGNDILFGGNGDDTLLGGKGNDIIYGESGKNIIQGGAGDDIVYTGQGEDTIVFGRGDGYDIIKSSSNYKRDDDDDYENEISFEVNPLELIYSRAGSDLDIALNGSSDRMTIENWFSTTGSGCNRDEEHRSYLIEEFNAANGMCLEAKQVSQLIQAMATFTASNNLSSWSDAIQQKPQETQQVLAQYWAS